MLGRQLPSYDLFLIVIGPLVLLALHFALARTRFGRLVRAATQDREMVGALGVNQAMLFTAVFALGAALAGLGGALQVAREPANLATDLIAIGDAFVVVVVGGMGSITGRLSRRGDHRRGQGHLHRHRRGRFRLRQRQFLQAHAGRRIPGDGGGADRAPLRAARPRASGGALDRRAGRSDAPGDAGAEGAWPAPCWRCCCACRCWRKARPISLILGIDVLIAVIFATSLHFIMGPGGMHSFGHAAYFGLGAYGAALLVKWLAVPMGLALVAAPLVALAGALLFGWFAVRLSGVYLAMLTLAFAQIVWAIVFQWEELTGGSNGVIGVWPPPPFDQACGLFPADAGAGGRRRAAAAALSVRAVRLRHARRARFAAARRGHRHRRQARALARLRHCGRGLRRRRRACSPSPRARSRRKRSTSAARSTAW